MFLFLFLRKINSKFFSREHNSVKPQGFLVYIPETSGVTEEASVSKDNFCKNKSWHHIQFEKTIMEITNLNIESTLIQDYSSH